ncbi:MAG TPA: iron-sulfur cluster assembly protein [Thermomicrobiales bacterium]|nr:iron-sulfur cluster assembly protein [Thermomicrobiales bacterium]
MPTLLPIVSLVHAALREVEDPELGVNIVDLGLIYDVLTDGADVRVVMTLTTPGCPLHATLRAAVDRAVRLMVPGVGRVDVDLVWEPRWDPSRITDAGREALGWTW